MSTALYCRLAFAQICVWLFVCSAQAEITMREVTLAGRPVTLEIHAPEAPPRGAVVLAHGFMRSGATMRGHAQALAREGLLAFVPDLPYVTGSGANGQALVELVAMIRDSSLGDRVDRVVLAGFSAGGLSALLAAASPDVEAYIALDPIDHAAGEGLAAALSLNKPAALLYGPPASCNGDRIAHSWSKALPLLVEDRLVENASHCDFESPTDGWCTVFCGSTDPVRQALVREALMAVIRAWFPLPPAPAPEPAPGPTLPETADDGQAAADF